MVIDYQTNYLPKAALEKIGERESFPRVRAAEERERSPLDTVFTGLQARRLIFESGPEVRFTIPPVFWEGEQQVVAAEEAGISVIVSAAVLLSELWDLEADEAAEVQDIANAEMARVQRMHPERFVGTAVLPLNEPTMAMEVLDRAIGLGLRGVLLPATIEGGPIVNDQLLPLYERMDEAGLTIVLHPGAQTNTRHDFPDPAIEVGFGWLYHSGAAAFTLILSGILDVCPNLTVIHPHLGGAVPWGFSRWNLMPHGKAKRPILDYLRERFYVDTGNTTPGALAVAANIYGADRIVMGSDYPWLPFEPALESLDVEATPDLARAIKENAVPGLIPGPHGA